MLGNRLHLAFKRQISETTAVSYARKHNMSFFEVSPLCNFNVQESFTELARIVLQRYGMESLWKNSVVLPLKELCCRAIVAQTTSYGIERLPLPTSLKSNLKSYSTLANTSIDTLNPCYRIYHSTQFPASNLHQHPHMPHLKMDKDNTLRRRAMSLFACDAESSNFNHHPTSACKLKDNNHRNLSPSTTKQSNEVTMRRERPVESSSRSRRRSVGDQHRKSGCVIS